MTGRGLFATIALAAALPVAAGCATLRPAADRGEEGGPSGAAGGAAGTAPSAGETRDERGPAPRFLSSTEREVLEEINRLRADPAAYAALLETTRGYYEGRLLEMPGETPVRTVEGVAALDDAIRDLRRTPAAPAVSASRGMSLAARDHARDLGASGGTDHRGSDGSDVMARLHRYGRVRRAAGEALMFGDSNGRQVVMSLVVDDGVPDRGHRRSLLDPVFRVAGVSCGPHRVYGSMCAIALADDFTEGRGSVGPAR